MMICLRVALQNFRSTLVFATCQLIERLGTGQSYLSFVLDPELLYRLQLDRSSSKVTIEYPSETHGSVGHLILTLVSV